MDKKNYIYTRESTKRQAKDGYNLKEQQDKSRKYIEAIELEGEVVVLEEYGVSAKTLNRPRMKELIQLIKKGCVNTVVVYKLDRLTRRLIGLSELLTLMNTYDVGLISVSEAIDIRTATGRLLLHIICMLAEWEQDTISERTLDGLEGSALLGNYCKGGKTPFGYKRYKKEKGYGLRLEENECKIVKRIYDLTIDNYSSEEVTLIINDDDYMKKKGKTFCSNSIRNILHNKIYLGIMVFQGTEYEVSCDSIVTREQFDMATSMLHRRTKVNVNNYLYRNKIKCSCGSLCIQQVTNKKGSQGVRYYLYYYCEKCNQRISEERLNEYVIPKVMKIDRKSYENDMVNEFKEKIIMIEDLKKNIYELYLAKQITVDTYIGLMAQYESDYQKTKEEYESFLYALQNKFEHYTYDYKKRIINHHLKFIIVDMMLKIPIQFTIKKVKM